MSPLPTRRGWSAPRYQKTSRSRRRFSTRSSSPRTAKSWHARGELAKTIDDDGELGLGERVSSQGRLVETVIVTSRRRSCTVPGMPSFVSAPSLASRAAVSGQLWNWNDCFEPSAIR